MSSVIAGTSVGPERPWPLQVRPEAVRSAAATAGGAATIVEGGGRRRMALRWLEDAALLLLLALVFPLVILAVGAPVALFVRLLVEIGHRL